jgi:hypothetical protein
MYLFFSLIFIRFHILKNLIEANAHKVLSCQSVEEEEKLKETLCTAALPACWAISCFGIYFRVEVGGGGLGGEVG